MPTIVCAISLICADFDLGGFAFTIFALISISIFLLRSAFKNGSAEVGARLLRVVARAVATAYIVQIAELLAVVAHSIARERSAILAQELCALGVRRVFLCPAHSFKSLRFGSTKALAATSGTCPFPMALSLSTLSATP